MLGDKKIFGLVLCGYKNLELSHATLTDRQTYEFWQTDPFMDSKCPSDRLVAEGDATHRNTIKHTLKHTFSYVYEYNKRREIWKPFPQKWTELHKLQKTEAQLCVLDVEKKRKEMGSRRNRWDFFSLSTPFFLSLHSFCWMHWWLSSKQTQKDMSGTYTTNLGSCQSWMDYLTLAEEHLNFLITILIQ